MNVILVEKRHADILKGAPDSVVRNRVRLPTFQFEMSIALSLTEAARDSLLTDQSSRVRALRHCAAEIMVLTVLRGSWRWVLVLTERSRRRKVPPMGPGVHRKGAAPTPEDCPERTVARN